MYLDKTGSTATSWNWKGPLLTSSNSLYYWASGTTTNSATGFAGFYFGGSGWGNTAGTIQYSSNNTAAYNYCSSGNKWAADSFIFGGWQRVEWIFKTSSTAGAPDGAIAVNRIGKMSTALATTGCITHGNTSDLWRYVSIPQGFTNITGGTLNLKMYFDDIYIDNSLARVELCDSSTWAERTHCEIQPATSWTDTNVIATFNRGQFNSGITAYLYVVSSDGNVNSTGKPIVLP